MVKSKMFRKSYLSYIKLCLAKLNQSCIFKKVHGMYSVKVAWLHTTDYLKWVRHYARNLMKVLTEVWKDKKSKENIKEKKQHEISNTLHWGPSVFPKTDDEIYVSISIGKYIITFHLFSVLCQRRSYCWKYRTWG